MKKKFIIPFICLSYLFTGCSHAKRIPMILSPNVSTRYAYYQNCVDKGYAVVFHEPKDELQLIAMFELSDGTKVYFYPADGYEFYMPE